MYKKFLFAVFGLALLTVLFASCKITDTSVSTGPSIKMGSSTFAASTITVPKGDTLTLVDSASAPHTVVNGRWNGTQQAPQKEAGAPTVNASFGGNDSKTIGPFTTAGTFDIYCTIHQGMNLTITVK
ncbi:MAG TPA: plastocyanin/azurin family copper-binding protein [Ktedonobacteraceae bacterium]|jgi:plastocyanin